MPVPVPPASEGPGVVMSETTETGPQQPALAVLRSTNSPGLRPPPAGPAHVPNRRSER